VPFAAATCLGTTAVAYLVLLLGRKATGTPRSFRLALCCLGSLVGILSVLYLAAYHFHYLFVFESLLK
jgi:hypothetical protein